MFNLSPSSQDTVVWNRAPAIFHPWKNIENRKKLFLYVIEQIGGYFIARASRPLDEETLKILNYENFSTDKYFACAGTCVYCNRRKINLWEVRAYRLSMCWACYEWRVGPADISEDFKFFLPTLELLPLSTDYVEYSNYMIMMIVLNWTRKSSWGDCHPLFLYGYIFKFFMTMDYGKLNNEIEEFGFFHNGKNPVELYVDNNLDNRIVELRKCFFHYKKNRGVVTRKNFGSRRRIVHRKKWYLLKQRAKRNGRYNYLKNF